MMLSSEIFYTLFADSYKDYSFCRKKYLSSIDRFIIEESSMFKSIVDVGSGDGKRGRYLADNLGIEKLTLIDNSKGMVNLLKKIHGADIIRTDISSLKFKIGRNYDLVLLLWNVLGHIPLDRRVAALINLANLVNVNGLIFIDVNNRYNVYHYGLKAVIVNIFKDVFLSNKLNGDYNLKIKSQKGEIETTVHLFTSFEIEKLIKLANLRIIKRRVINYDNGRICRTIFGGQLMYELSKI